MYTQSPGLHTAWHLALVVNPVWLSTHFARFSTDPSLAAAGLATGSAEGYANTTGHATVKAARSLMKCMMTV